MTVSRAMTLLLTAYQKVLSPLLGPRCRFYPSCSEYAKQSFVKYPLTVAARRSLGRLARCHPLHPGGIDLP
jgi:putative membrane protein insertion efficiency factor